MLAGLSSEIVKKKCPSSVEVVCYNGANSCTVAGPSDAVRELVMKLKSERVFATEVYSANIAYHSRYIKHGGSIYHDYLQKVLILIHLLNLAYHFYQPTFSSKSLLFLRWLNLLKKDLISGYQHPSMKKNAVLK